MLPAAAVAAAAGAVPWPTWPAQWKAANAMVNVPGDDLQHPQSASGSFYYDSTNWRQRVDFTYNVTQRPLWPGGKPYRKVIQLWLGDPVASKDRYYLFTGPDSSECVEYHMGNFHAGPLRTDWMQYAGGTYMGDEKVGGVLAHHYLYNSTQNYNGTFEEQAFQSWVAASDGPGGVKAGQPLRVWGWNSPYSLLAGPTCFYAPHPCVQTFSDFALPGVADADFDPASFGGNVSGCVLQQLAAPGPSAADLTRAATPKPRAAYLGAERLNAHLAAAAPDAAPCADFSVAELGALLRQLWARRDPRLAAALRPGDRRNVLPWWRDAAALNATLSEEEAEAAGGGAVAALARDGRCHEAALLWAHHTAEPVRGALSTAGARIPLLPPRSLSPGGPAAAGPTAGAASGESARRYRLRTGCLACHMEEK